MGYPILNVRKPRRPKGGYPYFSPMPWKQGRGRTPAAESTSINNFYRRVIFGARKTGTSAEVVQTNINDLYGTYIEVRNKVKRPGWKLNVAKGLDASNSYSRTGGSSNPSTWSGSGYFWSFGVYYTTRFYGSTLYGKDVQDGDDTVLQDVALSRLKRTINSSVGSAQLAAPLAESREIHRLVRQINGFTMDMLRALLELKRSRGKSIAKEAGKIWLFFGFGVNPLIDDVAKAANAILDYQNRSDISRRFSASAKKRWLSSGDSGIWGTLVQGTEYKGHYESRHELSYRYVAGVSLKLRTAATYSVADHLGLTISDLPSVAWELTPYSWVVDYFTTVGPWLDDVFYTLPGATIFVNRNKRYRNEVVHYPLFRNTTGQSTWSVKNGQTRYFLFKRDVLSSIPVRQLRVKSFDEVAKNGLNKVLNLASVLIGRR